MWNTKGMIVPSMYYSVYTEHVGVYMCVCMNDCECTDDNKVRMLDLPSLL